MTVQFEIFSHRMLTLFRETMQVPNLFQNITTNSINNNLKNKIISKTPATSHVLNTDILRWSITSDLILIRI